MYFVIFGTDKPGMAQVRDHVRPMHRLYLRNPGAHPVKVLLGGPTLTGDQAAMNGTLLIVEAESIEHVEDFVRDDPYSEAALFSDLSIRPWSCGLGNPKGAAA